MDYNNISQKGFVVLIAVMVTTIILTVGIGVLNLALREFILANVGRDSTKAFYATDTGIDCIFSYDVESAINPTQPKFASPLAGPGNNPQGNAFITCNGQQLRTGPPAYVPAPATCDYDGAMNDCLVTKPFRGNDVNAPLANRALCLNTPNNSSEACVGACVIMEVRKIATGAETQRTELVANGISDCQGTRPVERSLILTWE